MGGIVIVVEFQVADVYRLPVDTRTFHLDITGLIRGEVVFLSRLQLVIVLLGVDGNGGRSGRLLRVIFFLKIYIPPLFIDRTRGNRKQGERDGE